jgi:hypothetical protein
LGSPHITPRCHEPFSFSDRVFPVAGGSTLSLGKYFEFGKGEAGQNLPMIKTVIMGKNSKREKAVFFGNTTNRFIDRTIHP